MLGSTRRLEKGLPWETAPSQNTPVGARLGDVCQEPGVFASIHAPTTSNQAACPGRPECPSAGLCPQTHIIPFHQVALRRPLSLRVGEREVGIWQQGLQGERTQQPLEAPSGAHFSALPLLKGGHLAWLLLSQLGIAWQRESCAKVNDGAEESWRMWLRVWLDTDSECWSGCI